MRFKIRNSLANFTIHRKIEKDWESKIMEWLLYFGCFFPFIQFVIYIGSDTQPTGLLVSVAIVLCYFLQKKVGVSARFGLLVSMVLLAGVLAVFGVMQVSLYDTLRAYFGYISLFFIPVATYLVLEARGGVNERLLKLIIWIWFAVGFIQKYINSTFLHNILSRAATNEARGVVSLFSEPSAYGYMCLVMLLFVMKFEKNKVLYMANLLIQIVVFAQSSVTLVYLAAYIGMYMINELVYCKKHALFKAVVLFGGGIGSLLLIEKFARQGSRIQVLVHSLFNDPERLLNDGSITLRVNAITYSIQEFVANYGMPHGMSQKIMSGIGTVLYEFGIFGIILVAIIAAIIWRGYERGEGITCTFGFLVMMFSSIPFSAPVISFYLGWCLYCRKQRVMQHENASGEIIAVKGRNIIRRKEYESSVDL